MGDTRNFERVAENYLQALMTARQDAGEVVRELEGTAAYLLEEGQAELAEALRQVIVRRLTPLDRASGFNPAPDPAGDEG